MGALAVQLTESDLEETDARFRQFAVAGERYTPEMMALVHGLCRATLFRRNGAGSAAHYFVGTGTWGTVQSDNGRALSFHG